MPFPGREGRFLHVVYNPERDGRGDVVAWVASVTDITDRKLAELALRQSQEHLELLSNTVPASIFIIDSTRRLRAVNDAFTKWFGVRREEVVGLTSREFVGERAYTTIGPHLERALAGESVEYEAEIPYRLGGTRWVHAFYTPHRDPSGRVAGIIGFSMDITREKRAELALLEADRRKDDFLAMLGHELRNPLTPISLSLGLMRRYGPDRPEHEKAQRVIERQVQQLTRLVEDLLEVSRVTSGKITLHKERTDVASVVNRAVETSHHLIEAKRHHLTVLVPPKPVELDADPIRLAQALTNLLNNAAKYTEPGGRITLTVEREGDEAVFRVRDTGIGIDPKMLETVFEPFVQVHQSLDRSQGGLGLGLPLVRALVQMHGGTVKAFSDGLGKGSELVVRVPAATVPVARATSARARATTAARGHRILVVDDSSDIADALKEVLTLCGNEVRTAADGPSALVIASGDFRPEIVFLDIGLPGMDGYEVARRLRKLPGLERVFLVALTGYGLAQDRERSKEAGFDHHLVKPVEPHQVEEVVTSLD
jgi:PAS domain S-box-containing protein